MKRDGKKRPLGIPTLEDRILQRALALLMEPIYDQWFSCGQRMMLKMMDFSK